MSKEKETNTPRCPPQSELPSPQIIWASSVYEMAPERTVPVRVVLAYQWKWYQGTPAWVAEERIVLEAGRTTDAMGQPVYTAVPLTELPLSFFTDVVRSFNGETV